MFFQPADNITRIDDILARVDALRREPTLREQLADLLAEQSPIYAGRGSGEAERLRGYVLASFEWTGLPSSAVAYVAEELESGRNVYAVAAAAKALRGADTVSVEMAHLLMWAIGRVRHADEVVSFDNFHNYIADSGAPATTALMELFRTLTWLGPRARTVLEDLQAIASEGAQRFSPAVHDEIVKAIAAVSRVEPEPRESCCGHPARTELAADTVLDSPVDVGQVQLQDQDGAVLTFEQAFSGRPSVIAFFYTRCMNPEKCSLTITRLGRLQRRLADQQPAAHVNVAGITYDPAFDSAPRLRRYGEQRGMAFDERSRLWRTTGSFVPLQRRFQLGVGYGPVTVNRHRIDLIVLDEHMAVRAVLSRRLWNEDEVLEALSRLGSLRLQHSGAAS
jgi:protein SCO1/2